MDKEFKIKIVSDSKGDPQSLDNISLEAAGSLTVILESLADFARTYNPDSDVKLKIESGSIVASLAVPTSEEYIIDDIEDIIEGKSSDKKKSKYILDIQEKIKQNGLHYEVFFEKQNQVLRDLTSNFKGQKFIIRRGHKTEKKIGIEFIEGVLFEAGGKSKTNIHIDNSSTEFKIECSREQARKINQRLYSRVFLSVIKAETRTKIEYQLIDSYLTEEKFNFYKDLHNNICSVETIEKYDFIYNAIRNIVEDDSVDNSELIKILKLYDNSFIEKGVIRTILMSIKPIIKENDGLVPHYQKLVETFRTRSKTKKI